MKKIVLYGAGGHCISLINLIEHTKKFKIIGIIGKKKELNKNILNYKVNYTDGDLISLQKKCKFLALSITNYLNLKKRDLLIKKLSNSFILPNIISRNAKISKHIKMGIGNQIFDDVIINAGSIIGNHCVINHKSLLEHNVFVKNNVHISTGCIINGNCFIEDDSFIGSGSILRQDVKIRKNKFIKMGSIIKK